jgi:hypothetical protein
VLTKSDKGRLHRAIIKKEIHTFFAVAENGSKPPLLVS